MAPSTEQKGGARGRAPGQLFAEVALVVVVLTGLALAWPSTPTISQPSEAAIIHARTSILSTYEQRVARQLLADGKLVDDMAPPRDLPWRVPIQANPMPSVPYVVSPEPVQLLIASQNLHPLVESVGVDRYGSMSVPRNYFDVGWYNLGPVPGDPGDAVIDGHAGYPDQPLVFGKLSKMRLGERIVVVLADGSRRAFSVTSVKSWPFWAHPAGLFQGDGPARLTLITCSGEFNDQTHSYHDRLVLEAAFVGPA
jgi:hypothetical protein